MSIVFRSIICLLILAASPPDVQAGTVSLPTPSGGDFIVKVKSIKELRFRNVVKQLSDFSCGSAALATLLTYHYEDAVSEQDVFNEMFDAGNQDRIQREGFSLLDIKNYLVRRGYQADGYKTKLDKLTGIGLPAIVLINHNGYRHFVVVKGVNEKEVLLGDPALGARTISRAEFEPMWNGILFLVRNKKDVAKNYFNSSGEWQVHAKAPVGVVMNSMDLARVTFLLPGRYDF